MKILAETIGSFTLQDIMYGETIPAHRPAVVPSTNFFQARMGLGQVKMLGELVESATDAEFKEFIRETITDGVPDMPLAVESFLSKFGTVVVTTKVEPEPEPEPEPESESEPSLPFDLQMPDLSGMKAIDAKEALNLFAIEHFDVELDTKKSVQALTAQVEALISKE